LQRGFCPFDGNKMFNVGRYDPDKEKRQHARTSSTPPKDKRRKRPRTSDKKVQAAGVDGSEPPLKRAETKPSHEQQNDEGNESDSSSSVPSSSDESEEIKKSPQSTLHVIAPKATSTVNKRKVGLTDEGFDDFDVDSELLDTSVDASEDIVGEQAGFRRDESELPDEIKRALHMSSLPIEEAAAAWDLAPFLIDNLKRDGYDTFFPIQSLVIPDVIASERHSHIRARDVCVAAPTGSGKTLSFVLPVLNALAKRQVRRLRALVILPSRDLASQVYQVFEKYSRGSDLRVGLAIGQSDFAAEQRALTVGPSETLTMEDLDTVRHRYFLSNGNLDLALEAFPGFSDAEAPPKDGELHIPKGGMSAIDVLVSTPGRLIDHLDRTPGFTLQHLRFCVIDEADRLVNQSYHNWIGRVIASANEASVKAWHEISSVGSTDEGSTLKLAPDGNSFVIEPITWRRGGTAGDASAFSNNEGGDSAVAAVCRPVQLRKLLFSATLTKDPQKLAALGLVNPKHFDAHHLGSAKGSSQRYSMPAALSEFTVECTAEQKPLVLLAILLDQLQTPIEGASAGRSIVVVFTSSLDSTHRLVRLLQLLWSAAGIGDPSSVAEFSSALNQSQRTSLMKKCTDADGDVSVVVCSDGMSRGMDIPSVSAVVNYDVPSFAKTYVHRCGRTARAGKKGMAVSVLKGGQVKQFLRMRKLIDNPSRVKERSVNKGLVRDAVNQYRACVKALRAVIQAEEDGDMSTTEAVPPSFIPR